MTVLPPPEEQPDPIEQLYIESSTIGLVEFRNRINEMFEHSAKARVIKELEGLFGESDTVAHIADVYDRIKELKAKGGPE